MTMVTQALIRRLNHQAPTGGMGPGITSRH